MSITLDGTAGVTTPAVTSTTETFTNIPAITTAPSMVRVNTISGYGVTNTKIFKFTNTTNGSNGCVIQGSDISYTKDSGSGLGDSFTINTNGVYGISFSIGYGSSDYMGITLNTTQPTTTISGLTNPGELVAIGNASTVGNCSATIYLVAGSVIRAQGTGTAVAGTPSNQQFCITRVN